VSGGCAVVIDNRVHKTGALPSCPSVVFSSLPQFLKHHKRITKSHIAFVVDAPEQLELVSGLLSLGYVRRNDGHYLYSSLQEESLLACLQEARSEEDVQWEYRPIDRLKELIKDDSTDAVVNKLRSLLYGVADKEVRSRLTNLVFQYLMDKVQLSKIMDAAYKDVGPKTCTRIKKHLTSNNAKEVRLAYTKYRSNPSKIESICRAHKVSAFTLKYLEAKTKQGL
jgi:hypothetical protein